MCVCVCVCEGMTEGVGEGVCVLVCVCDPLRECERRAGSKLVFIKMRRSLERDSCSCF